MTTVCSLATIACIIAIALLNILEEILQYILTTIIRLDTIAPSIMIIT